MKIWIGRDAMGLNKNKDLAVAALVHYKKRLDSIQDDKQVEDLPKALLDALEFQSKKGVEQIDNEIELVKNEALDDNNRLEGNLLLLDIALKCYKTDLEIVKNTMSEKYSELFNDTTGIDTLIADVTTLITDAQEYSKEM